MASRYSVLLVDASNVIRRVFEPLATDAGEDLIPRASQTAVTSLRRAVRETRASHCLVVFEGEGTTWRHRLYPAYKKTRQPVPPEYPRVVAETRGELLRLGVSCVHKDGFEADDVIASVATRLDAGGLAVTVLSNDKDFLQLVSDNVCLRNHFARDGVCPTRGRDWVEQNCGVPHHLFIDAMALIGDPVDNIPGVDGIGPKRAAHLLRRWGSLDRLIEKRIWIPGTIGNNLRRASWEQLELSRTLFTLKTDIELGLKLSDIRVPPGFSG